MTIEVVKSGMQTSIQDLGRSGYMHLGVAKGGVMDTLSMQLANWLVGNTPEQAVLEICLLGPTLRFREAVSVAISGAQFEITVTSQNGQKAVPSVNHTIHLRAGDTLTFGKRLQGARAYLAVAATFSCDAVLGSCSTHFSAQFAGFSGRALQTGDVLPLTQCNVRKTKVLPVDVIQQYSGSYHLRCVPSVETNQFSVGQQSQFFTTTYSLRSDSNRMGLRFDGEPLTMHKMEEMISSGLTPGSVQLPPSGTPIVSSVDGQTIGGYPRIANVISADLFALGQLVAGDKVNFSLINIQQAQTLYANQLTQLAHFIK